MREGVKEGGGKWEVMDRARFGNGCYEYHYYV